MRTLVINTYAGSLLLGAQAMGAEILGSYEDAGYGSKLQEVNFPDVELRTKRSDWPDRDLDGVVVLAHPPCSAFSAQNNRGPHVRGVESEAFECTRRVLDYAMKNRATVICIESVVGALAGAWWIHHEYAKQNGYHLYRILQNGWAFGTGQFRERFWVVFIREGVATRNLSLTLKPQLRMLSEVLEGYEDGPSIPGVDEAMEKLLTKIRETCSEEDIAWVMSDVHHPALWMLDLLQRRCFPDETHDEVARRYFGGRFKSGQPVVLSPRSWSVCLLSQTWWVYRGRNLSEHGYKRIMGFPADYIFPGNTRPNYRTQMRAYLSKGVIPQVAQWILGQVWNHLGVRHPEACTCMACGDRPGYQIVCRPDGIADLRMNILRRREDGLPPLRQVYADQHWLEDDVRETGV